MPWLEQSLLGASAGGGELPWAQALAFFLATFVLEDAAILAAGALLSTASLAWSFAFWPCFLGVWLGDVGLYAMARTWGRPWFERSRWRRHAARVQAGEGWFARRGGWVLVFSRMVPGARLPTYLAAGFLRIPLGRFLLITGAASFVWTLVVLESVRTAGGLGRHWGAAPWQAAILAFGGIAAAWWGWAWTRQGIWRRAIEAWRIGWARWRRWEFWPAWMFYPPVVLWCLWLAVKYRGLSLPTAANPGLFTGGMVGESKIATLHDLMATSPEFTAPAECIPPAPLEARMAALEAAMERHALAYPVVVKPDQGQRGAGVKRVRDADEARAVLAANPSPLLVQRHVPGPFEAGVFYYRFPGTARGRIFAITEKVFPVVHGDGRATLAQLVAADDRARLVAAVYRRRFGARWDAVVPAGAEVRLVEAGNHAQGCVFRDGGHLLTPELERVFDGISRRLPGFFVGRYDVRCVSPDDLRRGGPFQILELNGAAAEATSIYDARHSLVDAYRTLFAQWELVFAIGAANRRRGHLPTPWRAVWRAWRAYVRLSRAYPVAD